MPDSEPIFDVYLRTSEVLVSAVPEDNINHGHFSVAVAWRGPGDVYAVTRHRQCLGSDGSWDYEPMPSGREDNWIATHRFPYVQAVALARQACLHLTVNGFTVADILAITKAVNAR